MPIIDGKCKIVLNAVNFEAALSSIPDHSTAHEFGGTDVITLDKLGTPTDITDLNASTAKHGLCPKGEGTGVKYLRDDITWGAPEGVGGVTFGTTAGTACEGDDVRLADNRYPTGHAASHKSDGVDAIKITELAVADNVTDLNATTTHPGLFPILSGNSDEVVNGLGEWIEMSSGTGSATVINSSASPCITIGPSGSGAAYICDGTYDNIQIQAALDAAPSGSEIWFLPGSYNIAVGVDQAQKNLTIRGIGKVTCNYVGTGSLVFSFQGATIIHTSLTANSSAGADTITLSSVAGIAAGDLIIVSNNVDWTAYYSGFKTGEMYEVKSVNTGTNVVTLEDPLIRAYTTAASSVVDVFRPVKITFDNINVVGSGKTASMRGLVLDRTKGCIVSNCRFSDCGMAGVWQYLSYDVKYDQVTVTDSQKDGYGYGIAVTTASAKTIITKCNLHGCRHTVTIGTNLAYPGLCRDIIITDNINYASTDGEPAVDAHATCLSMVVNNNVFYSLNGIACQSAAQQTVFVGNDVRSGNGFSFRDTLYVPRSCVVSSNYIQAGYLFADTDITDFDEISITDNVCVGSTADTAAVFIAPGACTIKRLKISDNTIVDAVHGISLQLADLELGTVVDISDNIIKECDYNGMLVRLNVSNVNMAHIDGNTIKDFNTSNGGYAGIQLTTVENGLVSNNQIFDLNGNAGNAIYSYSSCNNNVYIGNVAKGMTGTKFSLNETSKTSEHNISL